MPKGRRVGALYGEKAHEELPPLNWRHIPCACERDAYLFLGAPPNSEFMASRSCLLTEPAFTKISLSFGLLLTGWASRDGVARLLLDVGPSNGTLLLLDVGP